MGYIPSFSVPPPVYPGESEFARVKEIRRVLETVSTTFEQAHLRVLYVGPDDPNDHFIDIAIALRNSYVPSAERRLAHLLRSMVTHWLFHTVSPDRTNWLSFSYLDNEVRQLYHRIHHLHSNPDLTVEITKALPFFDQWLREHRNWKETRPCHPTLKPSSKSSTR